MDIPSSPSSTKATTSNSSTTIRKQQQQQYNDGNESKHQRYSDFENGFSQSLGDMQRHSSLDSAIHIDDSEYSSVSAVRFRSEVILNIMKLQRLQCCNSFCSSSSTSSASSSFESTNSTSRRILFGTIPSYHTDNCLLLCTGSSSTSTSSIASCSSASNAHDDCQSNSDDLPGVASCSTSDLVPSTPSEFSFILDILRRIMDEVDLLLKDEKLDPSEVLSSIQPYIDSWTSGYGKSIGNPFLLAASNSLSSLTTMHSVSSETDHPSTKEVATTTNLFPPNDIDVKLVIELSDTSSSDGEDDNTSDAFKFAVNTQFDNSGNSSLPPAVVNEVKTHEKIQLKSPSCNDLKKFSWAQIVTRSLPTVSTIATVNSTSRTNSDSQKKPILCKSVTLACKDSSSTMKKSKDIPISRSVEPSPKLKEKKLMKSLSLETDISRKPGSVPSSLAMDQKRLNETRRVLEMLTFNSTDIASSQEREESEIVKSDEILKERREILKQKLEASSQLRKEHISEKRRKAATVVKKSKKVVERTKLESADVDHTAILIPVVKSVFVSRIKTISSGVKYLSDLSRNSEDENAAANVDFVRQFIIKKSSSQSISQKLFDSLTKSLVSLFVKTDSNSDLLLQTISQFLLELSENQSKMFIEFSESPSFIYQLIEKYFEIFTKDFAFSNKAKCFTLYNISSLCSVIFNVRISKNQKLDLDKKLIDYIVTFCKDFLLLDKMKVHVEYMQMSKEFPWPTHMVNLVESLTTILSLITDVYCFETFDDRENIYKEFSETMKRTEFVGLITMLNSVLFHPKNRPSADIPKKMINTSFNVLRIINNFASNNVEKFQTVLVCPKTSRVYNNKDLEKCSMINPVIQTQLFHLMSYFLKFCTDEAENNGETAHTNPKTIHLLHETILLVGFAVASNRALLSMVRYGQYPVVLQRLAKLPVEYFIRPRLKHILLPTLILCCEDADNLLILRQEVSPKHLYRYLANHDNQSMAIDLPARFSNSSRISTAQWQMMERKFENL